MKVVKTKILSLFLGRAANFEGTLDTWTRSTYWIAKRSKRHRIYCKQLNRSKTETEESDTKGSTQNINKSLRHR